MSYMPIVSRTASCCALVGLENSLKSPKCCHRWQTQRERYVLPSNLTRRLTKHLGAANMQHNLHLPRAADPTCSRLQSRPALLLQLHSAHCPAVRNAHVATAELSNGSSSRAPAVAQGAAAGGPGLADITSSSCHFNCRLMLAKCNAARALHLLQLPLLLLQLLHLLLLLFA